MKLWIDDFREPPNSSWTWAKTLEAAFYHYGFAIGTSLRGVPSHKMVEVITSGIPLVKEISFDHDLGALVALDDPLPDSQTTMPLARKIEEYASQGLKPPKWSVHSMNPVGKANLIATLERADRLYAARCKNRG